MTKTILIHVPLPVMDSGHRAAAYYILNETISMLEQLKYPIPKDVKVLKTGLRGDDFVQNRITVLVRSIF